MEGGAIRILRARQEQRGRPHAGQAPGVVEPVLSVPSPGRHPAGELARHTAGDVRGDVGDHPARDLRVRVLLEQDVVAERTGRCAEQGERRGLCEGDGLQPQPRGGGFQQVTQRGLHVEHHRAPQRRHSGDRRVRVPRKVCPREQAALGVTDPERLVCAGGAHHAKRRAHVVLGLVVEGRIHRRAGEPASAELQHPRFEPASRQVPGERVVLVEVEVEPVRAHAVAEQHRLVEAAWPARVIAPERDRGAVIGGRAVDLVGLERQQQVRRAHQREAARKRGGHPERCGARRRFHEVRV